MGRDVIIACDFNSKEEVIAFLGKFQEEKPFVKIGMELFYAEGPEIVRTIKKMGHKIFLDLKLHDIPNTVYKAMRNLGALGVDITNVHAAGGIKMMEWAKRGLLEGSAAGAEKRAYRERRYCPSDCRHGFHHRPGRRARAASRPF